MRSKILILLGVLATMLAIVACSVPDPEVIVETVVVEVESEPEVVEIEVTVEVESEPEVVTETVVETVVETVEVVGLPSVDPLDFASGEILMAGSSTVFPLAEAMAARWQDEGGVAVSIDSIGSGGGFERFCVETASDISNASRPIKDGEVESCEGNGRSPIEFRVGTDALAVVVSAENDFVDNVTLEELAAIFSTAETWADVNADWPAEPIQRYIPGTDSGTFDYFVEEVFDENEEPILAASNLELSEDDNVLVQGATGSPYGVAFFGYAYFQENASSLKALSIDDQAPNKENVDAATYPLARPLYIYSDAGIIEDKPQVSAFINYFLANVNDEIVEVGYFPAATADLNGGRQNYLDAIGESAMMDDDMSMFGAPFEYSGDILMAGSSTVFPLAEAMAARWQDEGGPAVSIDSIGSGGGFERFCVETASDISNASRPIKDGEVESCNSNGLEPIEMRVGTDALAVVVSAENDFVDSVTLEELAAIFSTAETWADVNADWPAEPIQRYIPGTDSGTFDYFVEEVFDEDETPILAASNLELSEDDNVLVQGATGSPYGVAFFGYAYFQENAGSLKALSIDGVEPNKENVDAAAYPLARPLYIYSDAGILQDKPQVAAFINFFLTNVNEEIEEVGYFPAAQNVLDAALDHFNAAVSGEGAMMDDDMGMMLPEVDPLAESGDILMAGSSTVFPLAEAMAARWQDAGGPAVSIDSIGSGGGFERFCVETASDISNASRPIKDAEVESCEANGRTPIEFRVGTDALAVVVSAENDFVDSVTLEELAAIFSTAETWADVNADWPAEPIQRYIPGTDSGTFDYFVEEVFDEDESGILAASNLELSEDDNVLVQGATGSPYGVAFFGYAYFQENASSLKALSIDGVEPNKENVDAAEYPLARPLYIYSTANIMQEKPQVAAFINYFLTNVNEIIEEVGYFPAAADVLQGGIDAWMEANQ